MASYTESSRMGFGGRMGKAITGILFGILLSVGAAVLLFWNEGRTVKRHRDLKQGAELVVTVSSDQIDAKNEGKLVHTTGMTATAGELSDDEFGVSAQAIKLIRNAEMYQWKEKKTTRTEGSGSDKRKVTEYSYSKEWLSEPVNSESFKQPNGHRNPGSMRYRSRTSVANQVTLGAFTLPDFFVGKINKSEPLSIASLDAANDDVKTNGKLSGNGVYFGQNPDDPAIGDIRVEFKVVLPGTTSVVAQQSGQTFARFQADNGTIELLNEGSASAAEMFAQAESQNRIIGWAIRFGGFVAMGIGLSLLFGPLVVLADYTPFFGGAISTLIGKGTGLIAFLIAGIISSVIIAVAWIAYRPLIGISVLVITVGCLVLLVQAFRKRKREQAALAGGGSTAALNFDNPPPLPPSGNGGGNDGPSEPPPLDLGPPPGR